MKKKVSRNIRVQTIHTSKGAEAANVAIVSMTRGDHNMYYNNGIHSDRLAYVAESRHSNRLYRIGLNPLAVPLVTAIDDRKQV